MTRIESGVTIPKGLFTLYLNVKKVTRGRQPEGNFERQTRVLDCEKKFLAIYICPEVYSEENRPKIFFPRSIISEIFPRENFRLIKL
jgi:hypothetical protein